MITKSGYMPMIRSKFTTYQFIGQFVLTAILIVCVLAFYGNLHAARPVPLFSRSGLPIIFCTIVLPVYIIAQMKLNYKITIIDTDLKTISFKMFLLPITRTYPFGYFEGYIHTVVKDKYGEYKCFYLVKEGKLMYKMSGRFYSNIDQLHEGLSSLKDRGFLKLSASLSIKIAFKKRILAA